jgi:hypothetical protein
MVILMKVGAVIAGVLAIAGIVLLVKKAKAQVIYTCAYCGETFTSFEALFAHVRDVHPDERLPIQGKWD